MERYSNEGYSNEPQFNAAGGWAFEVAQMLHGMNEFQALCLQGQMGWLQNFYSTIGVLYDHIYSDIHGHDEIEKELKEAQVLLDRIKRLQSYGVMSTMLRQRRERTCLEKLTKIRRLIDYQMKHNGIKGRLKMDPKAMARQAWFS